MNKAIFKTLPVQGAVQIKVLPHISNFEAAIIFVGGVSMGMMVTAFLYQKQFKVEFKKEEDDE